MLVSTLKSTQLMLKYHIDSSCKWLPGHLASSCSLTMTTDQANLTSTQQGDLTRPFVIPWRATLLIRLTPLASSIKHSRSRLMPMQASDPSWLLRWVPRRKAGWQSSLWKSMTPAKKMRHLPDYVLGWIAGHLAMPLTSNDDFLYTTLTLSEAKKSRENRQTLLALCLVNGRFNFHAMRALHRCIAPIQGDDIDQPLPWHKYTPSNCLSKRNSDTHRYVRSLALCIHFVTLDSRYHWAGIDTCSHLTQLRLKIMVANQNDLSEAFPSLPLLPHLSAVVLHYSDTTRLFEKTPQTRKIMRSVCMLPNLRYLRTNHVGDPASYSALLKQRNLQCLALASLSSFLEYRALETLLNDLENTQELGLISCTVPSNFFFRLSTMQIRIGRITVVPLRIDSHRSHILLRDGRSCLLLDATFTTSIRLGYLSQLLYYTLPETIQELVLDHVEINCLAIFLSRLCTTLADNELPDLHTVHLRGWRVTTFRSTISNDYSGAVTLLKESMAKLKAGQRIVVKPADFLARLQTASIIAVQIESKQHTGVRARQLS